MNIRVFGIANDSIVDGPGLRLTVFTQGCPHRCPGCHNPQSHDFDGGRDMDTDEIIRLMRDNVLLDGLTLSGGDPFCQPIPCAELARAAHAGGLNVWAYSGWTFEQLLKMPECAPLLKEINILVDGPFILEKRSLECRWRGSTNQRLIDVPASLREGNMIEYGI